MDKHIIDMANKYGILADGLKSSSLTMAETLARFFKDKYNGISESITEFNYTMEYFNDKIFKPSLHWGQFKLFVSELQAYNKFFLHYRYHPELIVYAGGASGHHWCYLWPILKQVNPQLQVFLIDPNDFHVNIAGPDNLIKVDQIYKIKEPGLYCIKSYFTDDTAGVFKALKLKTLFISDIRGDYNYDALKGQMDIYEDTLMQEGWVKLLKPDCAYLKLHIPYPHEPLQEWVNSYPDRAKIVDGHLMVRLLKPNNVYFQAYAGSSSTELRGIYFTDKSKRIYSKMLTEYGYDEYGFNDDYWFDAHLIEQKLFAYNVYRQVSCKSSNDTWVIKCVDSDLSELILAEFNKLFEFKVDINEFCRLMGMNFEYQYRNHYNDWAVKKRKPLIK
jgi:hypothetical protein